MNEAQIVSLVALYFANAGNGVIGQNLAAALRAAVENLTSPDVPLDDRRLSDAEVRFIREGRKIAAIKAYRERTGHGLRDSKHAVEWLGYGFSVPDIFGGPREQLPPVSGYRDREGRPLPVV